MNWFHSFGQWMILTFTFTYKTLPWKPSLYLKRSSLPSALISPTLFSVRAVHSNFLSLSISKQRAVSDSKKVLDYFLSYIESSVDFFLALFNNTVCAFIVVFIDIPVNKICEMWLSVEVSDTLSKQWIMNLTKSELTNIYIKSAGQFALWCTSLWDHLKLSRQFWWALIYH